MSSETSYTIIPGLFRGTRHLITHWAQEGLEFRSGHLVFYTVERATLVSARTGASSRICAYNLTQEAISPVAV